MLGYKAGKVLIISLGVPPSNRASTVVVENLASGLSADKVILAGELPYSEIDSSGPPDKSSIYYVGISLAKLFSRGRRYFRWILWLELPLVLWRLSRIIRRENCNLILTVFPNGYYLLLGYLMATFHKLPFYPWFHNTYVENRKGWNRIYGRFLQKKVFGRATKVLLISEGMKEYYEKNYTSEKFEVLTHSFSIPEIEVVPYSIRDSDSVQLLFAGTFNETCYDATRSFHEGLKGTSHVVSYCSKVGESVFAAHGITGENARYLGFLPYDDMISAMRTSDFCLITHGFQGGLSEVEYKTIFPTRLLPLMYSGRAIIAHCPEESFLARFLRKYDAAEVISKKDPRLIQSKITSLANSSERRHELARNAYQLAQQFSIQSVTSRFEELTGMNPSN